jgi:hypothetical protein
MKLYAIRKRKGRWAVCSDETVILQFDSYDEALGIARSAAGVLTASRDRMESNLSHAPPVRLPAELPCPNDLRPSS